MSTTPFTSGRYDPCTSKPTRGSKPHFNTHAAVVQDNDSKELLKAAGIDPKHMYNQVENVVWCIACKVSRSCRCLLRLYSCHIKQHTGNETPGLHLHYQTCWHILTAWCTQSGYSDTAVESVQNGCSQSQPAHGSSTAVQGC